MENISDWLAGWTHSCGFAAMSPPPPPEMVQELAEPLDTTYVSDKLQSLASEGMTLELAAYLDRLGIAVPHGGLPIQAALCAAVEAGQVLCVHLLARWHGGSLTKPLPGQEPSLNTPLIVAAQNNHVSLCSYLLQRGVPVDCTNSNGWAPIHFSAAAGHEQVVQKLLDFGANPIAEVFNTASAGEPLSEIEPGAGTTACKLAQDAGHHHTAMILKGAELPSDPMVLCVQRMLGPLWLFLSSLCISPTHSLARGFLVFLATLGIFCMLSIEMSIAFAVGWYLLSRGVCYSASQRVPKAHETHGKEPLGVMIAALLVAYWLWITTLSSISTTLTALFWIFSATMVVSLVHCSKVDPGRAETGSQKDEDMFLELIQEHRLESDRFCGSCQWGRPPRSKHCSTCGSCIKEYDHHCPGIGNCVGEQNRWSFVIFLSCLVAAQFIFLMACWAYLWQETLIHIQQSGKSDGFLLDSWKRLTFFPEHNKLVLFHCGFHALSWLLLLGLLLFHYNLIAIGLTTNEFINWKKYNMVDNDGKFMNPHDAGLRSNCIQFWFRNFKLPKPYRQASPTLEGLTEIKDLGLSHSSSIGDFQLDLRASGSSDVDSGTQLTRQGSCRKIHRRSNSYDMEALSRVKVDL